MTRGQKKVVAIAVVGVAGWIAYGFLHTLRHIPEAYAAWDTGTLLTEYMKQHDDRWPKSWDDLLTVLDSDEEREFRLHGDQADELEYARSLREKVSVDWSFDPANPGARNPITSPDGSEFSVVWAGAEPNEMVRSYLAVQASDRIK